VYVDGGVANVIVSNVIERNGKEGICLDNGSTSNVVTWNVIQQNGQRWGEPDEVMAQEFIAVWGRLADGTAAAKVPGISIDNALYNLIYSNTLSHNFGGGIKSVRTGYYNLIGLNTIIGNNDGASPGFHFFGIELGAAPLDSASDELDGAPSRGNILFSNVIRGNHYAGIFFADDSDQNDVFDNVIMDAQPWALESFKLMPNNSLNNLTNLPSRNIGSGLSPGLLGEGGHP
jgi:parallel beta-helix repeat protein